MTITKKDNPSISYDDITFYEFYDGKFNAVYFSIWSENYGKDRKIVGISAEGSKPTRYMTPTSFEKYMKLRMNNGHSEFYSSYDEPKLKIVNEPKLMSGKRITATKKPAVRKTAVRKTKRA